MTHPPTHLPMALQHRIQTASFSSTHPSTHPPTHPPKHTGRFLPNPNPRPLAPLPLPTLLLQFRGHPHHPPLRHPPALLPPPVDGTSLSTHPPTHPPTQYAQRLMETLVYPSSTSNTALNRSFSPPPTHPHPPLPYNTGFQCHSPDEGTGLPAQRPRQPLPGKPLEPTR